MDSDYNDDLNLATRVAQGDAGAFNVFYTRHAKLVFAFIYHCLDGAQADAEELWQDTIVSALRALPGYRGQSQLSSWLCSIARHKVADFHRRKGRIDGTISSLPPEHLLDLMDRGPLPDEVLQQGIVRAQMVEALAGLPVECRKALIARYVDECPVDEIARRLGRSYKATESLLSRGRAMLRDRLKNISKVSL